MKTHSSLPAVALAGGAAAFVLRFLQNRTGFEAATGLPVPGNFAGLALVVCFIVLAAVLLVLTRHLPKDPAEGSVFPTDFRTSNTALLFLPVAGILLIALSGLADVYESLIPGNLLLQLKAAADPYAVLDTAAPGFAGKTQLLLGILTIFSAFTLFPAVLSCREKDSGENKPFNGTLLLALPVVLVVRLVLTYRVDSVNPALSAYYVELLALTFLTLSFYRLSSFAFNAGQTPRFAFYAALSVGFSLAALADGDPHLSSLLLYLGGSATAMGFLLLRLSAPGDVTRSSPNI